MTLVRFTLLFLTAACKFSDDGAAPNLVDATPDVSQDAGSNSDPHEPDARAATKIQVTCEDYTWTLRFADGSRNETLHSVAVMHEVGPEDDYVVKICQTPTPRFCPAGATCTGSTGPSGTYCYLSRRIGSFVDGALYVSCGDANTTYNAAGTMVSHTEDRPDLIEVTKL
jgi:hypothetical protein